MELLKRLLGHLETGAAVLSQPEGSDDEVNFILAVGLGEEKTVEFVIPGQQRSDHVYAEFPDGIGNLVLPIFEALYDSIDRSTGRAVKRTPFSAPGAIYLNGLISINAIATGENSPGANPPDYPILSGIDNRILGTYGMKIAIERIKRPKPTGARAVEKLKLVSGK